MRAFEQDGSWIVRIDRGEVLPACLERWMAEQGIGAATFAGIGALDDVELGYFDRVSRVYARRTFPESRELLSLVGNGSWHAGQPVVHAHVVLGGPDFSVVGGHLFRATVSVTVELHVQPLRALTRRRDDAVGLNLLADEAPEAG